MLLLAAWLHTLDPFLLRFSENFGIRWYGLSYVAGFVVAYLSLKWLSRRGACLIPEHRAADAMLWLIAGVLVGGRLGYVFVYQPSLLWTWLDTPPFWGVLALNQGGMASHGGMAGVILAARRISRGFREPGPDNSSHVVGRCPPMHVMDTLALLSPAGLFFGRVANFINGELLGRIVAPPGAPGPWWSVRYPQELLTRHAPTLDAEQETRLQALIATVRLPGESMQRGLERLVARAGEHAEALRPLLSARHPSQLYQAVAEGVIAGAVVWILAAKPRKPGVIGSAWLIAYGLLRILTEFWRLPDPQFADARPGGLSRGQWLSVAMVVAGLIVLIYASMRRAPRIGGWWRRENAEAAPT